MSSGGKTLIFCFGEQVAAAMFYEQLVLSKKGALAVVWLAAHCEKKLQKAQVHNCDVVRTIGTKRASFQPKSNF